MLRTQALNTLIVSRGKCRSEIIVNIAKNISALDTLGITKDYTNVPPIHRKSFLGSFQHLNRWLSRSSVFINSVGPTLR